MFTVYVDLTSLGAAVVVVVVVVEVVLSSFSGVDANLAELEDADEEVNCFCCCCLLLDVSSFVSFEIDEVDVEFERNKLLYLLVSME